MPTSVLIDTDPGIDDAVALALASKLPDLDLVAITTVHGNASVDRATRNARLIAAIAGIEAPIIPGAASPLLREPRDARETHGPEGLGHVIPAQAPEQESDGAADAIIAQVRSNHKLTLCCLGPLTNIATAIAFAPDIADALGPVFVMGGALGVPGTQTPTSEFNWWSDPEAADFVLHAQVDLRLVPLDVTRRIAVPGAAIRKLIEVGASDQEARFWADALRFYADFHREYEHFDGCVVNDALAVALVANPSLAGWEEMRLDVSLSDDSNRGAVRRSAGGGRVAVATSVRAHEVLSLIEKYLFARWVPDGSFAPGAAEADRWLAAAAARAHE
ncbi:MAG TPA: nucleoside hydrolase [Gemmatimonadaceae bacterium]|jgi:purine nucleosidase|nr:nucleoside hydrolase [Gemmatimonadaceae bacterium]